jgi:hypothetical protein
MFVIAVETYIRMVRRGVNLMRKMLDSAWTMEERNDDRNEESVEFGRKEERRKDEKRKKSLTLGSIRVSKCKKIEDVL